MIRGGSKDQKFKVIFWLFSFRTVWATGNPIKITTTTTILKKHTHSKFRLGGYLATMSQDRANLKSLTFLKKVRRSNSADFLQAVPPQGWYRLEKRLAHETCPGRGPNARLSLTWTDWAREMKVKPLVARGPAGRWRQVGRILREIDSGCLDKQSREEVGKKTKPKQKPVVTLWGSREPPPLHYLCSVLHLAGAALVTVPLPRRP